jgi:hypothetical protein
MFIQNVRRSSNYSKVRRNDGALVRLEEVEGHYAALNATQLVAPKTY